MMFCRDLPIQMCQEQQLRRRWKEAKVLQKAKVSGIKKSGGRRCRGR
jgi:hypothetical protein